MTWDDGLSEEQRVAASHLGGHACLLAGPGTGKTLSLTKRVLYLIEERQIPPSEILAVTFTRAATAELRKNLRQELGEEAELPHISTLHSFALRTILQNPTRTSLPQPIRIADDYEERWIIQEELRRILELGRVAEVAQLINQLSADWEQLRADWEARFPNPQFLGAWREHRRIYGYTLRAELVYQLKLSFTEGGLELPNPPRYLLVDEYQDLNACDLAVIKSLSEVGGELFGAGDDDQSIYAFRYANPEGIRRFENDYVPSRLLELTVCRRCDRDILDLGLYVARQDPRRMEKPLYCEDQAGPGIVKILRFPTQTEEADNIATICNWLVEQQDVQPEEILVLFRTDRYHKFSDPVRSALETKGIRVATVANPLEPLNCPKDENERTKIDGRYFLCLLRLLANSNDHLAWRTILDLRDNNLGTTTLQRVYELARNRNITFSDALQTVKEDPNLLPRFGERLRREVEAIEETLEDEQRRGVDELDGFIHELARRHIDDDEDRLEILRIFDRVLETIEPENLDDLLRGINISLGDVEQEKEEGVVNLMTMHQAKGLSSDAVIIVAAEDEYLPGRSEGPFEEDERRLLYVSITRARHFLFLTHCIKRTGRQMHSGRTSGIPRRALSVVS